MAKVGESAHTSHGIGTITESVNERGRVSFRVAGKGFNVWVPETDLRIANEGGGEANLFGYKDWADEYKKSPEQLDYYGGLESTIIPGDPYVVNEKNHTTLPWDGTPQYPHDMFNEQTLIPGESKINPDKRLHPSDSVSGASRSKPSGPQPNPKLFAGGGGDNPFADERTASLHRYSSRADSMGDGWPTEDTEDEADFNPRSAQNFRPAGLSDKYIHLVEADNETSPVARFRRDPRGFIRQCGYLWTDGDLTLEKFADYTHLLDTDPQIREAAWKDVRTKAHRLRSEGKVTVNDVGHNRIYATVQGDHGTYDVMLSRHGALSNSQTLSDWACACEWGRWAFKRQMTYVGRLCSHAYAAYLDMESRIKSAGRHEAAASVADFKSYLKENNQAPEAASVANYLNTQGNGASQDEVEDLYDYISDDHNESRERDYTVDHYTNDPDEAYKTAGHPENGYGPGDYPGNGPASAWLDHPEEYKSQEQIDAQPKPQQDHLQPWHGDWQGMMAPGSDGDHGNYVHSGLHQSDLLRQKPQSLTPNLQAVPEGEDEDWVDVTKDDRKTTGPDQIIHFSHTDHEAFLPLLMEALPAIEEGLGVAQGAQSLMGDKDDDQKQAARIARYLHGAEDAGLLDDLREFSKTDASEDNGHMEQRNDELRDMVTKLNEDGYGASYMVAATDDEKKFPSDGDANFLGQSYPNWADQGFAGSGPSPKDWHSDSAGYVDENERDRFQDVDDGDGDIIKFNDSRSKPQQGPRSASRHSDIMASLHVALDPPGIANAWDVGSGSDFLQAVGDEASQVGDQAKDIGSNLTPQSENLPDLDGEDDGQPGMPGEGGSGGGGGGVAGEGEAGELGALSKIPPVVAGFSIEAFDRGEFSTGELAKAKRAGSGPRSKVRVDPGFRGQQRRAGMGDGAGTVPTDTSMDPGFGMGSSGAGMDPGFSSGQAPPEDFGFDGGREIDAYLDEDDGPNDIVANFQRSGAAGDVMTTPRGGSSDDFASSPYVQSMLRTAGRNFSAEEQRELEAEFHPQGARNMPTADDLANTHYVL